MSSQDNDRTLLSIIKGAGYMFGAILFYIFPIPLISLFPTEQQGFHGLIILTVFMVIIFSVIGTLLIQERVQPVVEQKYSLNQSVKILSSRPVLIQFIQTLLDSIASGINSALLLFFFTFVLKRQDLYSIAAALYILGIIVGILSLPKLIKSIGKKNAKSLASGVYLISYVLVLFVPANNIILFLIIAAISSLGTGINMLLNYGIQADNMDYIEWQLGFRAEAAVAAINSFVIKAAQGIGSAFAAYLLFLIHFDENLPVQSSETIRGLYLSTFAIPAVLNLLALIIWILGYSLTEKRRIQMMGELLQLHNPTG